MSLTCVVGSNTINTFEYDKEQIRKWSNKGILKCPLCGEKMIYKHGEYKIPHFAHECSCEIEKQLIYSQPETEEHLGGKRVIYEWLKTQNVENLKLESWIPETKQRPDVYFEKDGVRYVVEYQCTPIATKYAERHRLYELAGIKDTWVFGVEKYDFGKYIETCLDIPEYRTKTIEREIIDGKSQHFICLNGNKLFIPSRKKMSLVSDVVKYSMVFMSFGIDSFGVDDLCKNNDIVQEILDREEKERLDKLKRPDYTAIKNITRNLFQNALKVSDSQYQFTKEGKRFLCEVISLKKDENKTRNSHRFIDYNYISFYGVEFQSDMINFDTSDRYMFSPVGNYIVGDKVHIVKEISKYGFKNKYAVTVVGIKDVTLDDLCINEQNKIWFNNKIYIVDGYYEPKQHCHNIKASVIMIRNHEDIFNMICQIKNNKKDIQIILDKRKRGRETLRRDEDDMNYIKEKFEKVGCKNVEIYWG